ncbi:carbon-nitrogen hydrolase family protein [Actinoallomurus sp. NPDC050550]|uniref:carbon-nitrogen hydrolase family protein n=1 Tax=Actinoallomurus sp. NPDC050550 TaxID=3154937 RepID=UPI0033CD7285
MSAETLTVALAQISPERGNVTANATSAAALIGTAAAAGARLLVFPELSLVGYDLVLFADPSAWITEDDPRLDVARKAAAENGVTAVLGGAYRDADGTGSIASLAMRPDGNVHVYRKHYLHGRERDLFQPGRTSSVLDVDGWHVALAICYDAAVPGHAEAAARQGAEIYAASALYTLREARRLDVHFAARAMDNRMFAVVANFAGTGPGWESCGGSGVWHPDGTRLTQAGASPGLVTASLARSELRQLRDNDALAGYTRGAV